jgi:hypothetical protein
MFLLHEYADALERQARERRLSPRSEAERWHPEYLALVATGPSGRRRNPLAGVRRALAGARNGLVGALSRPARAGEGRPSAA